MKWWYNHNKTEKIGQRKRRLSCIHYSWAIFAWPYAKYHSKYNQNMKRNSFESKRSAVSTLAKFGCTHEMIEDLPMHVLEDISNGRPSPVLPVSMEVNEGYSIKSRTRFALVRMADGNVDVMFYPVSKYAPLDNFTKGQQELLKQGKAVVADVDMPDGAHVKAFVQIDGETNQVMAVPTPVIGRNLQVLSDELCLGGTELKEHPKWRGTDICRRRRTCDRRHWPKERYWHLLRQRRMVSSGARRGKREWDKYTFGIYGCWVMDDDGNLDYVPEEEYTEELWNEQKKAAGRHASAVARK